MAKTFVDRGGYHVDADKIAREVVEPGTPGLAQLVDAFGTDILDAEGSLDRPALAAKAFVDDESRTRLNSIVHPLVGARTQELVEAAPADAIVIQDIPLLVENNMAPFFHLVVIVHADAELRVQRLTEVRGMPESDARARIAAQATEEQRRAVADAWLDNSGTPAELAAASAALWEERLAPYEANVRARRAAEPDAKLVAADPSPETVATRLTNRLWALAGDKAVTIDTSPGVEPLALTIRTVDDAARVALAERLPDGGFVLSDAATYLSADPGRPARVTLDVRQS